MREPPRIGWSAHPERAPGAYRRTQYSADPRADLLLRLFETLQRHPLRVRKAHRSIRPQRPPHRSTFARSVSAPFAAQFPQVLGLLISRPNSPRQDGPEPALLQLIERLGGRPSR